MPQFLFFGEVWTSRRHITCYYYWERHRVQLQFVSLSATEGVGTKTVVVSLVIWQGAYWFTKTFNPSFAQTESTQHSERRTQASQLLSTVAKKLQNPRLATLAVRVRLDAFTRVTWHRKISQ